MPIWAGGLATTIKLVMLVCLCVCVSVSVRSPAPRVLKTAVTMSPIALSGILLKTVEIMKSFKGLDLQRSKLIAPSFTVWSMLALHWALLVFYTISNSKIIHNYDYELEAHGWVNSCPLQSKQYTHLGLIFSQISRERRELETPFVFKTYLV